MLGSDVLGYVPLVELGPFMAAEIRRLPASQYLVIHHGGITAVTIGLSLATLR